MAKRWLLLETSGRTGQVGLGEGARLVAVRRLDAGRQHARDLAPAMADLLAESGWRAADLSAVAVSVGPGSYTGLRVGVTAAKAMAYATGCEVAGVPTFHCIARQATGPFTELEVVADALKGKLYSQSFVRQSGADDWEPSGELRIVALAEWRADLRATALVTGPGVPVTGAERQAAAPDDREARVETLLAIAAGGKFACRDLFALEPLYLRPSSAEEQWARRDPSAE